MPPVVFNISSLELGDGARTTINSSRAMEMLASLLARQVLYGFVERGLANYSTWAILTSE